MDGNYCGNLPSGGTLPEVNDKGGSPSRQENICIEGLASNPQRAPHILLRAFNMESFPEFVIIRYSVCGYFARAHNF